MSLLENDKFWYDLMTTHYLVRRADTPTFIDFEHDGKRTLILNQVFHKRKNFSVKYSFHIEGVFQHLIDYKHTGSSVGFHNGGFTRRGVDKNDIRDRFTIMYGRYNEDVIEDFMMSFILSHEAGR